MLDCGRPESSALLNGSMGKRDAVERIENGPTCPATDEQLVSALIEFANGRDVELLHMPENRPQERGGEREELQSEFSALLARAAENRAKLAEVFLKQVGLPLLASLRIAPAISFGRGGFTLAYARDFRTLRSALQYAVLLLLDLNQPFGDALCRCRLASCRAFYLAKRNPKGGPANRNYCSPKHRTEAH